MYELFVREADALERHYAAADREADRLYGGGCADCGGWVPRSIEVCRVCREWAREEDDD